MDDLERRIVAAGAALREPETELVDAHARRLRAARPEGASKRRIWGMVLGGVGATTLAGILISLAVLTPTAKVTDGGARPGETPLPLAVLDGMPLPESDAPPGLPERAAPLCTIDPARIHRATAADGTTGYLTRTAGDGVAIFSERGEGMLALVDCGTPATAIRRVLETQGFWMTQLFVVDHKWSLDAVVSDGLTQATFGDVVVPIRDNTIHLKGRTERVDEIVLSGSGAPSRRIDMRWLAAEDTPGPSIPQSEVDLGSPLIPSPAVIDLDVQRPSFAASTFEGLQRRQDDCMARNGAPKVPAKATPPVPARGFVYDDPTGAAHHLCAPLFAEQMALERSPLGVAAAEVNGVLTALFSQCEDRGFRATPGPRPVTQEQLLQVWRACEHEVNQKVREAKAENP